MAVLPVDVDDASNNKFLVSGQAAFITNPPSAWAVAKRDAPKVAEQLWTHGLGRLRPAVVREAHDLQDLGRGGPPNGTLYPHPNPYNHQLLSVAGAPALHAIAERIYTQATQTQMVVHYLNGEPLEKTLAWAESELEGFMRNWRSYSCPHFGKECESGHSAHVLQHQPLGAWVSSHLRARCSSRKILSGRMASASAANRWARS